METSDPRQFVLCRHWPNTPGIYGTTLQAIFERHGAAPLIAMVRWKKIDQAWPGVRRWIEAFLALPEVEPAGREAVKAMRKTKSLRAKNPRFGDAATHAQRERQREFGFS